MREMKKRRAMKKRTQAITWRYEVRMRLLCLFSWDNLFFTYEVLGFGK